MQHREQCSGSPPSRATTCPLMHLGLKIDICQVFPTARVSKSHHLRPGSRSRSHQHPPSSHLQTVHQHYSIRLLFAPFVGEKSTRINSHVARNVQLSAALSPSLGQEGAQRPVGSQGPSEVWGLRTKPWYLQVFRQTGERATDPGVRRYARKSVCFSLGCYRWTVLPGVPATADVAEHIGLRLLAN